MRRRIRNKKEDKHHPKAGMLKDRPVISTSLSLYLLFAVICFSLTGCGKKCIRIGFAQSGHESDWRTLSQDYAEEAFSKEKGFLLSVSDADNYPPYQTEAVREFIASGCDRILIDPLPSEEWGEILAEAEVAGIPVILINRHIKGTDKYAAWYGPDYEEEGRACGEEVLRLANKDDAVYVIEGPVGSEPGEGRLKGIKAVLSETGRGISLSAAGDFTINGGKSAMKEIAERLKEKDVSGEPEQESDSGIPKGILICMNDNTALGAISALRDMGIRPGDPEGIRIVSFNAQYSGLKAVLDGEIASDIESGPEAVLRAAEDMASGDVPTGDHPNKVRVFTRENVTEDLLEGRR